MASFALIGGRSINNLYNPTLENKIFDYLKIKNRNILFFPFACPKDMDKSFEKFQKLMENNDCNIKCVYDLNNINELIEWANILYFGGGHSEDLINFMKDFDFSNILLSNKLVCGISAGAIMLAKSGMGDRYVYSNNYHLYNYKMVDGLSLVPITVCPHYDHDGLNVYNDDVKLYDCCGFGLEDDTAIIVMENKVIPVKQDLSKSVYYFDKNNEYKLVSLYEELLL